MDERRENRSGSGADSATSSSLGKRGEEAPLGIARTIHPLWMNSTSTLFVPKKCISGQWRISGEKVVKSDVREEDTALFVTALFSHGARLACWADRRRGHRIYAKGNGGDVSLQASNFAENREVLRPLLGGFALPFLTGFSVH